MESSMRDKFRNYSKTYELWGFVSFVTAILTLCIECVASKENSTQYLIKQINQGKVKGYLHHVEGMGDVERYFGIPYAAPPLGDLRFEDPVDVESWGDNVLNATTLSAACLQIKSIWSYTEYHHPGFRRQSEDCLYLNVYVPVLKKKNNELSEVLVHIHGGSNEVGMGAMLHGDVLALKAGVIFVSLNYRLGPLGFLSGDVKHFPGNYGVKDQIKAMKWVQENIHHFGGDKAKVTIQGHSAGACDVGLHILSPLSKGLFRYAIMESGSSLAYWCVLRFPKFALTRTKNFAKTVKCDRGDFQEIKKCLKSVDGDLINNYDFDDYRWFLPFSITSGDDFLPDKPEFLIKKGEINCEAVMTGVTKNEGSWGVDVTSKHYKAERLIREDFVQRVMQKTMRYIPFSFQKNKAIAKAILQEEYALDAHHANGSGIFVAVSEIITDSTFVAPAVTVANNLASRGKNVYFYSFDYLSNLASTPQRLGVPHGSDLFYLFGSPLIGHDNIEYNDVDKQVSLAFIDMWAHFVKTGRPRVSNLKTFPKYKPPIKSFVRITVSNDQVVFTPESDLRPKKVNFWNHFMPLLQTVLNKDSVTCSAPVDLISSSLLLLMCISMSAML